MSPVPYLRSERHFAESRLFSDLAYGGPADVLAILDAATCGKPERRTTARLFTPEEQYPVVFIKKQNSNRVTLLRRLGHLGDTI